MESKKGAIEISIGGVVIILLSMSMVILGAVLTKNIITSNPENETINYTFVLGNETMPSIMVCENEWHYELIEDTIPCVVNDTIGGITGETINWSISPQENCRAVDGFFPGLNILNDTRSKELYDNIMPKCFEFHDYEISDIWLNASNCTCIYPNISMDSDFDYSDRKCSSYNCGSGLMVNVL